MNISLFDYRDYKQYINQTILAMPSKGRGVRRDLAAYLNCQTAYISQVLNKDVQFSLEHAVKINQFFKHSKEQARYFLLLVQWQRAGSKELRDFIHNEISEIIEKRIELKERLNIKDSLDDNNQHIYYSAWYFAATHIMLSIPHYQTSEAISKTLRLPLKQVQGILSFLCETGLAIHQNNRFVIGKTRIHLGQNGIPIRRHHTNWRNQAIASIDKQNEADLHYSSVLSMSKKDIPKVKEIFIKAIEESREIIKTSKEEKVQVIAIDFFDL